MDRPANLKAIPAFTRTKISVSTGADLLSTLLSGTPEVFSPPFCDGRNTEYEYYDGNMCGTARKLK